MCTNREAAYVSSFNEKSIVDETDSETEHLPSVFVAETAVPGGRGCSTVTLRERNTTRVKHQW